VIWREFHEAMPELAQLVEEEFERTGVGLVGTIRRDGSPRISPVEPVFAHSQLLLGMMWRSQKALDLLRDPRCILHSAITNPDGAETEVKLRGRALDPPDPELREQCHHIFRERWKLQAPASVHVFSLEIESVSVIAYDLANGEMLVTLWDPQLGRRETRRPYP
jgi:Pyridoxamine 5'-phosphate oxidase